jgi:8-oxo-dGTP diphosphatase
MDDWSTVRVFGSLPEAGVCVIRPSAYGLIEDGKGRLAVVRTTQGTFLPGGGIEMGETPEEAIIRETLEECGLIVRLGAWTIRAVQFAYSLSEKTHFEKRCIFIEGVVEGTSPSGSEADHELVWVEPALAVQILSHRSHSWAVEQRPRSPCCDKVKSTRTRGA